MSQRQRIQSLAITTFEAGPFYRVTYTGNQPDAVTKDANSLTSPASVHCNEIESRFEIDKNQGQHLAQKRSTWAFEILFNFGPQEVLLEDFELAWMASPPKLARTSLYPNATLLLDRMVVQHPVEHSPDKGTRGRLVIQALEGRI